MTGPLTPAQQTALDKFIASSQKAQGLSMDALESERELILLTVSAKEQAAAALESHREALTDAQEFVALMVPEPLPPPTPATVAPPEPEKAATTGPPTNAPAPAKK